MKENKAFLFLCLLLKERETSMLLTGQMSPPWSWSSRKYEKPPPCILDGLSGQSETCLMAGRGGLHAAGIASWLQSCQKDRFETTACVKESYSENDWDVPWTSHMSLVRSRWLLLVYSKCYLLLKYEDLTGHCSWSWQGFGCEWGFCKGGN